MTTHLPSHSPSSPEPQLPSVDGGYDIAPRPTPPRLPGTVVLREDADRVIDALASELLIHAHNCVRSFGDFHVALSGGSTPIPLYQRLMIDPAYRDLPWARTHLWIVDERRVPFDDDRSNFKMISEILGDHSGIPREQIHPMFAMADDADHQYTSRLREILGWRERGHDRLDYVLLGMGSDGHTASLFPHSPALLETLHAEAPLPGSLPLVRINTGPKVTPPDRVTMTLPLINAARMISVLVVGSGKRPMLQQIEHRASDPAAAADLPILGVRPLSGELRWYLDFEACPGFVPPSASSSPSPSTPKA